jgi:hypothetical protein
MSGKAVVSLTTGLERHAGPPSRCHQLSARSRRRGREAPVPAAPGPAAAGTVHYVDDELAWKVPATPRRVQDAERSMRHCGNTG